MRFLALLLLVTTSACSSSSVSPPPPSPLKDVDASTDAAEADDASDAADDASDAGDAGDASDASDVPVNMCSAVIATILTPIAKVSTGKVSILSDTGGVRTVYVDATAGGFGQDGSHPRVYLDLATATRVDIDDDEAAASKAWDLAIKRPVIFANDGDGGPGMGGVLPVGKAFDKVSAADASAKFKLESFTDADCNPKTDATGAVLTTMSDWYDYNEMTNALTPKPNTTYVVRGGTGKLYKVGITSYYATPDGGMGTAGGAYLLQIEAF